MFWWGLLLGVWVAAPLGFVLAGLMHNRGPDCVECQLWRDRFLNFKGDPQCK